ncbi:hypothetical protein SynA1560_02060 [Synechococcus sp. A15-60]|nr:hypothetical protein SynA1560_02060 [Synechococcus sp. A15-60]
MFGSFCGDVVRLLVGVCGYCGYSVVADCSGCAVVIPRLSRLLVPHGMTLGECWLAPDLEW